MTLEEKKRILSILERSIKCDDEPYCKTVCEECGYYIPVPEMVEMHRKLHGFLKDHIERIELIENAIEVINKE